MALKEQFSQAYDEYAPLILRHIYFRVSDVNIAEDLAQETFFKAWQYMVSQNGKIKIRSFKAFFYKVANNLVIDYYRQKKPASISIEEINDRELITFPEQEKEFENSLMLRLIFKNLDKLKEEHQQILLFRYVDDLSNGEISEITGRSAVNVRVIIHRALNRLKQAINEETRNS